MEERLHPLRCGRVRVELTRSAVSLVVLIALGIVTGCDTPTCPVGTQEVGGQCKLVESDEEDEGAAGESMMMSPQVGAGTKAAGSSGAGTSGSNSGAGGATAGAAGAAASGGSGGGKNGGSGGPAAGGTPSGGGDPCANNAGMTVCRGAELHVCDAMGKSTSAQMCMNEMLCQQGVAAGRCANCNPGSFKCDGTELSACQQGEFVPIETCDSAGLCKEDAGACTEMACQPDMTTCSNAGELKTCNADGSAFAKTDPCGAGMCDAANKRCNKCAPNSTQCNGSTAQKCSADGQTVTPMQCTPMSECHEAACGANGCVSTPKSAGTTCSTGKCNGSGRCVRCLMDADCSSAAGGECDMGVCRSDSCQSMPKARGTACSQGRKCDGNGLCATCLTKADCPNSFDECMGNRCVAGPGCGNGTFDTGENCETAGEFAFDPGTCNSSCVVTDSAYRACGGSSACPVNSFAWFCGASGACSRVCTTDSDCRTASGKGVCAKLRNSETDKFCMILCSNPESSSGCPVGQTCKQLSKIDPTVSVMICGTLNVPP